VSRGRDGPKRFLKDYSQVLLADGHAGYNGVVVGNAITRWMLGASEEEDHRRGKDPPEIAREAIALLRSLYAVEKQVKDASVEERIRLRRRRGARR
jgi:hypothetical protein